MRCSSRILLPVDREWPVHRWIHEVRNMVLHCTQSPRTVWCIASVNPRYCYVVSLLSMMVNRVHFCLGWTEWKTRASVNHWGNLSLDHRVVLSVLWAVMWNRWLMRRTVVDVKIIRSMAHGCLISWVLDLGSVHCKKSAISKSCLTVFYQLDLRR